MSSTRPAIDLSSVREVMPDIVSEVRRLDGSGGTGEVKRNANEAEMNRRLLTLADNLALASALVRNEYWKLRNGFGFEITARETADE